MLKLLLARHGLTQWNQEKRYLGSSDIPLNSEGKQQAKLLSKKLNSRPIDLILSSELKRAFESGNIIKANRELQVNTNPRLNELHFGVFEGLTYSEAHSKYPDMLKRWLEDYDLPPEGGQSFSSFSETVKIFINYLKNITEEKSILIVSHGGVIREIVRLALGLPQDNHWSFQIDPASLSEVHIDHGHSTIIHLNDTTHLQEE